MRTVWKARSGCATICSVLIQAASASLRRSKQQIGWQRHQSRASLSGMSEGQADRISRLVAEEVLATIFGDDLSGCPVSLDQVAAPIHEALEERARQDGKLIELLNTVVSSILQVA